MSYQVVFAPEAEAQLTQLYRYIADHSSPEVAARYTDSIVTYCEGLRIFPHRGNQREDIRPGLRVSSYRKRISIAFVVETGRVVILGVFYAGQEYGPVLREIKGEAESS
jgi:toxin ParE1/3/4